MLTFKELGVSPHLMSGIEELGFESPTPIQEKVIPIALTTEKDIVGLAQTGTGKTAAYGLPIINQININNRKVQALILAPTRELCIQITKDLEEFSKFFKGLRIVAVYGGASIETQIKGLKKGAHIITATPGRMNDLLNRKVANISDINTVVLDEADEMLNMGFREELDQILGLTPDSKRTFLFSATMPKELSRIAKNYMQDPVQVTIGKQNAGAENVRHIYYQVHAKDRYLALKRIADINPDIYSIVFCRTRMETKEVAEKLIKDGYNADAIHGDLSQAQRDHVMKRFREKSLQMLVATDVAARGIDVTDISHVINYNLPDDNEIYTHRSGRTGRAGKSGISISIVNYREVSRIPQIEKMINKKCEKHPIPSGEEVCQKKFYNLIDRMEKVQVDEKQIAPFMETVNKKLEWLSKEQIIKHFVSLEFNRFLEYYKDARDLNDHKPAMKDKGKNKEKGSYKMQGGQRDLSRIFINVGKKDKCQPQHIIGLINDATGDRNIKIGDIDIKDSFSFFEVSMHVADSVLNALNGEQYKGKKIVSEYANAPKNSKTGKKNEMQDIQKKKRKSRK